MSKKFKGLRCAYCDGGISITVDHVFSREFFLIEDRADLPKAPACEKCNGEKSRAEHYLTAVLPIAGRHAQARTNLETNLPKRLAKNRPLARHLLTASQPAWIRQDGGIYEPTRTVQFDGSQLDRLLKYVGRGLAWHHWKVYLRPEDAIVVLLFPDASSELFHQLICGMRPEREVVEDFGNGDTAACRQPTRHNSRCGRSPCIAASSSPMTGRRAPESRSRARHGGSSPARKS
jgi:hypothetical protein